MKRGRLTKEDAGEDEEEHDDDSGSESESEEEEESSGGERADPSLYLVLTCRADTKPLPAAWFNANSALARVLLDKERALCSLFDHSLTPLIQALMNAYAKGLGRIAITLKFIEEAAPRVVVKKRGRNMQLNTYADPLVNAGILSRCDETDQLGRAGPHKHKCVCYRRCSWERFLAILGRLSEKHDDLVAASQKQKLYNRAAFAARRAQRRKAAATRPPAVIVTTSTTTTKT